MENTNHAHVDGNLVIVTHFYGPFEVHGLVFKKDENRNVFWSVKDEVLTADDSMTEDEKAVAVELADAKILKPWN